MDNEITLTRKQLYDLVWSKPMRDAAIELNISDVGLAKLCKRHTIPRPPQGYWLRNERERSLSVIPLNGGELENQEVFHFYLLKKDTLLKPPPKNIRSSSFSPCINAAIDKPKTFPHPAISQLVDALRRDKNKSPYHYDTSAYCGLRVSINQQARALNILNELSYRITELGFSLQPKNNALYVIRDQVSTPIRIYEKSSYTNPITSPSRRSLDFNIDRPRSDLYYTGFLVFEFVDKRYSANGSLVENNQRSIEQCYDHIIQNIIVILDDNEKRRIEQLKIAALKREREALRAEAQFKKKQEEYRFTYIAQLANKEIAIKRLSSFLDDYDDRKIDKQFKNIHRMLKWAKGHLKLLKSQISYKQIEAELNANDLFSELYR